MGPHGERIGVGVAPDRSALLGLPRFGLERKTMPAFARSEMVRRDLVFARIRGRIWRGGGLCRSWRVEPLAVSGANGCGDGVRGVTFVLY